MFLLRRLVAACLRVYGQDKGGNDEQIQCHPQVPELAQGELPVRANVLPVVELHCDVSSHKKRGREELRNAEQAPAHGVDLEAHVGLVEILPHFPVHRKVAIDHDVENGDLAELQGLDYKEVSASAMIVVADQKEHEPAAT